MRIIVVNVILNQERTWNGRNILIQGKSMFSPNIYQIGIVDSTSLYIDDGLTIGFDNKKERGLTTVRKQDINYVGGQDGSFRI